MQPDIRTTTRKVQLCPATKQPRSKDQFFTDERDFGIYRWNGTEPFENLLPSYR